MLSLFEINQRAMVDDSLRDILDLNTDRDLDSARGKAAKNRSRVTTYYEVL